MPDTSLHAVHFERFGELATSAMDAAAAALSAATGLRAEITEPSLDLVPWEDADIDSLLGALAVPIDVPGAAAASYLIVPHAAAAGIAASAGGGRLQESSGPSRTAEAFADAARRMAAAAAATFARAVGAVAETGPARVAVLETEDDLAPLQRHGAMVWARFRLAVHGVVDDTVALLTPAAIAEVFGAPAEPATPRAAPLAAARGGSASPTASSHAAATFAAAMESGGPTVRAVEFAPIASRAPSAGDRNIDMLMDVNLQVTVELGRTRMRVRDILSLGLGAVVELDRLAGEPVDLYLNDRLFARGEVVVIEESFGVRITEILSPEARVHALSARAAATAIA